MSTYADMPDADKKSLDKVTNAMREEAGQFCRLAERIKAELESDGTSYAAWLVSQLDDGERVRDESGLSGAISLTKAEWQQLYASAASIVALLTPELRKTCINAAGPRTCVG